MSPQAKAPLQAYAVPVQLKCLKNLAMLRIMIISYLLFQTIFCNHTYKPMYCL